MIWRSAFSLASPGGKRARLSVLIFHRVTAIQDPLFPGEPYAAQFDLLVRHVVSRFRVLPLTEAVDGLARRTLPPRALAITFDDGYSDNLSVAAPILKAHSVPATVFVSTGYLDGACMWNDMVIEAFRKSLLASLDLRSIGLSMYPLGSHGDRRGAINDVLVAIKYLPATQRQKRAEAILQAAEVAPPTRLMLDRASVRELQGTGLDVGAHTITHPILARLEPAEARREIEQGKLDLESIAGKPVRLFAYPNGKPGEDFCAEHVRMVREAGFAAAFTTAAGSSTFGTDLFQLPRFTPWSRDPMRFDLLMWRNLRQRNICVCQEMRI